MHLKKAQDVINKLRKTYNEPTSMQSAHLYPQRYCVGGALGRGTCGAWKTLWYSIAGYPDDRKYHYPCSELIGILQDYNPELPYDVASNLASDIIHYNDNRKFAEAWQVAEAALAWPTSTDFSSAELAQEQ